MMCWCIDRGCLGFGCCDRISVVLSCSVLVLCSCYLCYVSVYGFGVVVSCGVFVHQLLFVVCCELTILRCFSGTHILGFFKSYSSSGLFYFVFICALLLGCALSVHVLL